MKAPQETLNRLCNELRLAEMRDIHEHLEESMAPLEILIKFLEYQSKEKQKQTSQIFELGHRTPGGANPHHYWVCAS